MIKTYQDLVNKVSNFKIDQNLDLSSGEDLSIGIMNLISIEEHLFFTYGKTKNPKYLKLLNEVRKMRVDLLKEIIKDYEGEVWCISKHLLSASMRIMEVGTKELKKGENAKAEKLFKKSYELYSLFWGLNLSSHSEIAHSTSHVATLDAPKLSNRGVFGKINEVVQHALDCCRE